MVNTLTFVSNKRWQLSYFFLNDFVFLFFSLWSLLFYWLNALLKAFLDTVCIASIIGI